MSIKGMSSIIKQREQQFGPMIGEKVAESSEDIEYLKQAIATLADNQNKIYKKLEELISKLEK